MEMEERKLTQEEILTIVESASMTISNKLEEGAVIVPKLIRAALDFYVWLMQADKIEEEPASKSRDVLAEMLLADMKQRAK